MGFQSPLVDPEWSRQMEEAGEALAAEAEARRRSERRWRIATFVVAVLALGVAAGSLIVALVK